jgi:teichuronic acid biosynthesis glycosyltransferase TuaC
VTSPRVLVLAQSYPSEVFPTMGLWTERLTSRLAREFQVLVVAPTPYSPPLPSAAGPLSYYAQFRLIRDTRINGVDVRRPRQLVAPGSSFYALKARSYSLAAGREARRIRKTFEFDLIHAHFSYPDGVAGARLAKRHGVPLIISEHAPWDSWMRRRSVRRPVLAAARRAAAIVAVSTSVRDSILPFVDDPSRVHVVPVGVDETTFVLGSAQEREPGQVLYVGFLNFNKGVDVLLRAMRLLSDRGVPARLLLVGGGDFRDTHRQARRLQALASELDVDEGIRFLGQLTPAEVAKLMRESSVLVLPSRAESFGAVLVEALASGTPVIATSSGGPQDIVAPEVGRLVPPGDPAPLAEAIANVLGEGDRYPARRLREFALERYRWDDIADRYRALYAAVLGWGPT